MNWFVFCFAMSRDTQIGFYKSPQRIGLFPVNIDEGSDKIILVYMVNVLVFETTPPHSKTTNWFIQLINWFPRTVMITINFFKTSNRSVAWKTS